MGKTIYRALIVDDEPLIRNATDRALSSQNFSCCTANDGKEALQKFKKSRHDLVVTDLRMPGMHGHALILELLKSTEPPHIVALTGISDCRIAEDLLNRGVFDVVQKPVDFNMFAVRMRSLFDRKSRKATPSKKDLGRGGSAPPPVLTKIEKSMELFSLCIPSSLDTALTMGTDSLNDPAPTLVELIRRLSLKRINRPERRVADRFSLLSTVVTIPVNKDFVVQGEASKMVFCDISETGACIFNTRSSNADYLALRWRSLIMPNQYLTSRYASFAL